MHRVVAVRDSHYVCLGDNTYTYERVLPEYCIGLVTAIRRGKRVICVNALGYQIYSRFWVMVYPLRRILRRGYYWLRRQVKQILFRA